MSGVVLADVGTEPIGSTAGDALATMHKIVGAQFIALLHIWRLPSHLSTYPFGTALLGNLLD